MKNLTFHRRLRFAFAGLFAAYRNEQSFRIQIWAGALALLILYPLRPAPIWWALFLVLISLIWALELLNTAIEALIDRLHPEVHSSIRLAKDCAAAAVLMMSVISVLVFCLFVWDRLF